MTQAVTAVARRASLQPYVFYVAHRPTFCDNSHSQYSQYYEELVTWLLTLGLTPPSLLPTLTTLLSAAADDTRWGKANESVSSLLDQAIFQRPELTAWFTQQITPEVQVVVPLGPVIREATRNSLCRPLSRTRRRVVVDQQLVEHCTAISQWIAVCGPTRTGRNRTPQSVAKDCYTWLVMNARRTSAKVKYHKPHGAIWDGGRLVTCSLCFVQQFWHIAEHGKPGPIDYPPVRSMRRQRVQVIRGLLARTRDYRQA